MSRPLRVTKKFDTFITLALGLFLSVATSMADFSLKSGPAGLPADAEISIAKHDIDQRSSSRVLVSKTGPDGTLHLDLQEEAGVYIIKIDGRYEATLAIAANEQIKLSTSGSELIVQGSPGSSILKDYERLRKESLSRLVYPTRSSISAAKARGATEEEIVRLTQAEVDAYEAHTHELNDFIIENAKDSMAFYGSSLRLNGDYRIEELIALAQSFQEKHGDITASRSLNRRIQTALQTALGNPAPEISAPNLSGVTERVSDYRGRYVLVDFWASWCPPCRLENKHYAKLTSKTKEDQFTIFAVNLDTKERSWSRAVTRDKADWVTVSDLRGWTSPLAATYGVNALPSSFLLDPEGRIIAKNLRGLALDAKLQELGLL